MELIERPANDPAQPFRQMADRIAHNAEAAKFGGAVVIVPPEGGGDQIEVLFLDQAADAALFWSTLKSKVQMVLEQLADREKQAGWGRGR